MANYLPQNSPRVEQTWDARFEHLLKMLRENPLSQAAEYHLAALEKVVLSNQNNQVYRMAAQVSIYPLRQTSLSPAIDMALATFKDFDLDVIPGAMSSMVIGHAADLWAGLQAVYHRLSAQGDVVIILTLSNACPEPTT